MSSMQLVKDDEGQSYIPPSQRPDGTWRRPIRVKDGYVPQDEQPVYVSKGRQTVQETSPYPVGLGPADIAVRGAGSFSVGYFDIGNYTPTAAIPGLNFVEPALGEGVVGTKSKSKKSKKGQQQEGSANNSTATSKQQGHSVAATAASAKSTSSGGEPSQPQIDPVKRLRNLRKRLKEIEELEKRIMAGDLSNPEKEQLEKLKRKDEVLDEVEELEKLVSKLSVS